MARRLRREATLLVVLVWSLIAATPGRADIGVVVLEPVGALGFFTRVGHAAIYLSNICPDDSPVKMRPCRPDESGGVVSRYAPLSQYEDYDWAIVPLEFYLHGFESPDLLPLLATPALQHAIERADFGRLFAGTLHAPSERELPEGQWRATLANRFSRGLYIFAVTTTAADDAVILAAFNSASNRSHFNFFYGNCSNQAKAVFDLVWPGTRGDRVSGITMETPKGLVKALVAHAVAHPEVQLRAWRYPQLPGTFSRSREILFPMENTYKSVGFAPWWFFGGFREVAVGAMVYHEVVSPFSLAASARAFMTPAAARLAQEQFQLRRQQDVTRRAFAHAVANGLDWSPSATASTRITRRLSEIRKAQRAEVQRVTGSTAQWRHHEGEFRAMVRALPRTRRLPPELEAAFQLYEPQGALFRQVVRYLDAHGRVSAGVLGRGPWIALSNQDGTPVATGLSPAEILSGDAGIAVLVLAAAIDYHLDQSAPHRIDLVDLNRLFGLFSQATATVDQAAAAPF